MYILLVRSIINCSMNSGDWAPSNLWGDEGAFFEIYEILSSYETIQIFSGRKMNIYGRYVQNFRTIRGQVRSEHDIKDTRLNKKKCLSHTVFREKSIEELSDVIASWSDLEFSWKFAHICRMFYFEVIPSFALSQRVLALS